MLVQIEGKKNPSDSLSWKRNVKADVLSNDVKDMQVNDVLEAHLIKEVRESMNKSLMALTLIKH